MAQSFYVWYDNLMENHFASETLQTTDVFLKQILSEKNLVLKLEAENFKDAIEIYRKKVALKEYKDLVVNEDAYLTLPISSSKKFLH